MTVTLDAAWRSLLETEDFLSLEDDFRDLLDEEAVRELERDLGLAGVRYDTSPLGLKKNWVTKAGGLPLFVRAIAHALMRDHGMDESKAIAIAISRVKKAAVGRWAPGKAHPVTQSKGAEASAHWEAMKASTKGGRSDLAMELLEGARSAVATAGSSVQDRVHEALRGNYPPDTLDWVDDADWRYDPSVPLSQVKMARRPGGARDLEKVAGMVQALKQGKDLGPVVLVEPGTRADDAKLRIADGYHRALAHKRAGKRSIKAFVGTNLPESGPWDHEMHDRKLNRSAPSYVVSEADACERGKLALNDMLNRAAPDPKKPFRPDAYDSGNEAAEETVECPSCHKDNAPDAQYCDQCGFHLGGALGVMSARSEDMDLLPGDIVMGEDGHLALFTGTEEGTRAGLSSRHRISDDWTVEDLEQVAIEGLRADAVAHGPIKVTQHSAEADRHTAGGSLKRASEAAYKATDAAISVANSDGAEHPTKHAALKTAIGVHQRLAKKAGDLGDESRANEHQAVISTLEEIADALVASLKAEAQGLPDPDPVVAQAAQAAKVHKVKADIAAGNDGKGNPASDATPAPAGQRVGPEGFVHGWVFVGKPSVGDKVHHHSVGTGTITKVHHQGFGKHKRVTGIHVRFDDSGIETDYAAREPGSGEGQGLQSHEEHSQRPAMAAASSGMLGNEPDGDFRSEDGYRVGPKGFVHGWIYVGGPGLDDRVHHAFHGDGTITESTADHVKVKFDKNGSEETYPRHTPKALAENAYEASHPKGHLAFAEGLDRRPNPQFQAAHEGLKPGEPFKLARHESAKVGGRVHKVDIERVSDKPWAGHSKANYTPEQLKRAALITRGNKKQDQKLPVREPDGTLNRHGVYAAAAVLAGGRGGVNATPAEKRKAARELLRHYTTLGETPPQSIVDLAMGGPGASGRREAPLPLPIPSATTTVRRGGEDWAFEKFGVVKMRDAAMGAEARRKGQREEDGTRVGPHGFEHGWKFVGITGDSGVPMTTAGRIPGSDPPNPEHHAVGVNLDPNSKTLLHNPTQQPGESDLDFHNRVFAIGQEHYKPVHELEAAASQYRRSQGLPDPKIRDWTSIPAPLHRTLQVGEHFAHLESNPNDPEVKQAYDELKRQTAEQWKLLTDPVEKGGMGVKVDFVTPEEIKAHYGDAEGLNPYPTADAQARDLEQNHHLAIATIAPYADSHHPLLTNTKGGEYDRFRAVHDAFGHAASGADFTRHGEFQAWLHHSSMFSGDARRAASTELTGENSFMVAKHQEAKHKAALLPLEDIQLPWDAQGNYTSPWGAGTRAVETEGGSSGLLLPTAGKPMAPVKSQNGQAVIGKHAFVGKDLSHCAACGEPVTASVHRHTSERTNGGQPLMGTPRESGMRVGPHGYVHGWIKVGADWHNKPHEDFHPTTPTSPPPRSIEEHPNTAPGDWHTKAPVIERPPLLGTHEPPIKAVTGKQMRPQRPPAHHASDLHLDSQRPPSVKPSYADQPRPKRKRPSGGARPSGGTPYHAGHGMGPAARSAAVGRAIRKARG